MLFTGPNFVILVVVACVLLIDAGMSLPTDSNWEGMDAADEALPGARSARKASAHRLLPNFGNLYAQRRRYRSSQTPHRLRDRRERRPKFSRQADTDDLMDRLLHIRRHGPAGV